MNEEELFEELKQVNEAIKGILQGGQSYTLNSGGGSRAVTQATYDSLVKHKKELMYELSCIQGTAGILVNPGW